MKNISKKLLASFIILAMMVAIILPTITFATEEENLDEFNFDYTEEPENLEDLEEDLEYVEDPEEDLEYVEDPEEDLEYVEDPEEDLEYVEDSEDLEEVTDISQIKLNRKIVFSGTLYKQKFNFDFIKRIFNKNAEATPNYKEEGTYEEQKVLVTMILPMQGKVKVAFIKEGNKLPTFGYIDFADEDLRVYNMIGDSGKYMDINLDFEEGANLIIKANGETYPITSKTTVQMIKGESGEVGIRIGEKVIFDDSIELISANGEVELNITEKKVTTTGEVSVYDEKVKVNGTASLALIENGIEVSGDATVNDKAIAGGTAEITYDTEAGLDVEVTEASAGEKELDTTKINSVIDTVIAKVKEVVKGLLSKLFNR